MKGKKEVKRDPEEDLRQYVADVVDKKKPKIFATEPKKYGRYGGIGIEWQDYNYVNGEKVWKTVRVEEPLDIGVSVFRSEWKNERKEIIYFAKIKMYQDKEEYFSISDTAEKAFAVKDLLDDMIDDFRKKGGVADEAKEDISAASPSELQE